MKFNFHIFKIDVPGPTDKWSKWFSHINSHEIIEIEFDICIKVSALHVLVLCLFVFIIESVCPLFCYALLLGALNNIESVTSVCIL